MPGWDVCTCVFRLNQNPRHRSHATPQQTWNFARRGNHVHIEVHRGSARRLASPIQLNTNWFRCIDVCTWVYPLNQDLGHRSRATPCLTWNNVDGGTCTARTHSIILREASAEHTGVLYTQPIRNNYIARSKRIAGRHFEMYVVVYNSNDADLEHDSENVSDYHQKT